LLWRLASIAARSSRILVNAAEREREKEGGGIRKMRAHTINYNVTNIGLDTPFLKSNFLLFVNKFQGTEWI